MTEVLSRSATAAGPDGRTGHGAGHDAPRWRVGDGFLLRVAGQAAEVTSALRTEQATAWAQHVLQLEAARNAAGDALRADLEVAIAVLSQGHPGRIALINLRRDVFNIRPPRPATLARAEPLLRTTVRGHLGEWVAALASLREALHLGRGIVDADIAAARSRARVLLADDALRNAVLLQSEVLERNMDRYLTAVGELDKRGRQVERTLLELLYRAALKTSPFSTLTSVGLGRLAPSSDRPRPAPVSLRQHSTTRLNVAVLARLSSMVLADPVLRSDIRVTLAPGASSDGETMRYVRRRASPVNDGDAVVAIDSVHEDLFFLPSGPALAETAALTCDQRPTLHALAHAITVSAGARSTREADQLLGHLLRLGFLVAPDLQVDLRSPDPSVAFAAALADQPHGQLQQAAAGLTEAKTLIAEYARASGRDRAALLAEIRRAVHACFNAVGAPARLVPRTLLYEDTTVTSEGMDMSRGIWTRHVLPDLADLVDVLPAFDLNLPRRLTARGFFRARYGAGGRCDDVTRFCHEFHRDFFDAYTQRALRRRAFDNDNVFVPQENWFGLADIEALDRAREAVSRYLRDIPVAGASQPEEIQLGPGFVATVCQQLPASPRLDQPWSFFVQLASAGSDPHPGRLVLNQAYTGLTLMFSRFAHSLDTIGAGASDMIRQELRRYAPRGAVLAELSGGYETTNLNIHPVVTDYEIVCPGDVSARPPDEQISLDDLVLVHDPEADQVRLLSTRLGCEVIPVYLGFLLPMALPEVQQVLLCFSPSGMAQIDLWAGSGQPIPNGITTYPRLVLGNLVLQRRMWKIDKNVFPLRNPRHSDAEHLVRVARWRRDHRIPERVFAQIDNAAATTAVDGGAADAGLERERKTGRKPLPVDFASWFSLELLDHLARGASARIVLTEANPDVHELWLRDENGRPHVSEMLIELYDTAEECHVKA
ncbi:MAG: lantibiotic dehydratase [Pseudonocardiaceae bacterium]